MNYPEKTGAAIAHLLMIQAAAKAYSDTASLDLALCTLSEIQELADKALKQIDGQVAN